MTDKFITTETEVS